MRTSAEYASVRVTYMEKPGIHGGSHTNDLGWHIYEQSSIRGMYDAFTWRYLV